MIQRTIILFIFILCVSFLSCNSDSEKKEDLNTTKDIPVDTILMLENLLSRDSTNIEVRTELAQRYYSSNNLGEAAFHFLKIYEQDNRNFTSLVGLGNIYYDGHQSDKAIFFYEKAIKISAKDINVRCDLATCYSDKNELKKSIELLRGNIKIDPKHLKSHYNLSVILQKNGNKKEAKEEMMIYESLVARNK
jgi:tetratricopeptide (TPR) repeat protein